MTSVSAIAQDQDFQGASPSATDKVPAATLDSQFQATKAKVNELLLALAVSIRDDNTLTDEIVRIRNLHPELAALIASKAGWQPKTAVAVATTANIVLTGEQTIDGVLTSASRVQVKNQTLPAQNGIYVSGAGAWSRATDADTAAELGYAFVYVTGGTSQAGTTWVMTQAVADIVTLGTTSLSWAQVGGTIGAIPINKGGTGATTAAAARTNLGLGDWSILNAINGIQVVDTIAQLKALTPPTSAVTYLVRGYYAAGDGGDNTFRWDSSDVTADNGGTVFIPNAGGTGRWNSTVQGFAITALQFGLKGDGVTDDLAALGRYNAWANANSIPMYFPSKTYVYSNGFAIDPSKTSILADRATFKWTSAPALGYCILVNKVSLDDYFTQYLMEKEIIRGVNFIGAASYASRFSTSAIRCSSATTQGQSLWSFRELSIQGFRTAIEFLDYSYATKWYNCRLSWGGIKTPTSVSPPVDYCENQQFYGCFINDGGMVPGEDGDLDLGYGDYLFVGGSIDNKTVISRNNSIVTLIGVHIEAPGMTLNNYTHLYAADGASIVVKGGQLVFSQGVPAYRPVFKVDDTNFSGGIQIDGLQFVNNTVLSTNKEAGGVDDYRTLCEGLGRFTFRNLNILSWAVGNSFQYVIPCADFCNVLSDGNFESGGLTYWTVIGTAASSVVLPSGTRRATTKSVLITGSAFSEIYQDIPCRPGSMVFLQAKCRCDQNGSVGNAAIQISFVDFKGNVLNSVINGFNSYNTNSWGIVFVNGLAPAGSVYARIRLQSSRSSGATGILSYFDLVAANITE